MICVTVMLAVFLGWPLAFGTGSRDRAERPAATIPIPAAETASADTARPQLLPAGLSPAIGNDVVRRPESCYSRFRRENRACAARSSAATCRLKAADDWDLCEATGFWPD